MSDDLDRLLEREIRSMYREIVNYDGNFGDPIETGSFNPFEMISRGSLTEFEREGVCVAMLCWLMTAIDNSTFETTVSGADARQVRLVLRDKLYVDVPLVKRALSAFLKSEEAFVSALDAVYRDLVLPQVRR